MIVKVFSFNLLSQALCNKKTFPLSSDRAINRGGRLTLILSILMRKMKKGYIICLQEVSLEYKIALTILFEKNNYNLQCENYGNSYGDFMGVAIAYPNDWKLLEYKIVTPCTLAWKHLTSYRQGVKTWTDTFYSWYNWITRTRPEENMISQICKVYNRFPLVRLMKHNCIINVCCIHMPCKYGNMELMSCYYSLIQRELYTSQDNLIVVGDFNSTREADLYNLITEGWTQYSNLSMCLPDCIHTLKDCFYNEEIYSYNSHTCINGIDNEFKSVIDYIFVDEDIEVEEAKVYPRDNKLLPNEEHPSDHCYLSVTLNIS